jgi:F0F1-type ATP synthase assembly protein I
MRRVPTDPSSTDPENGHPSTPREPQKAPRQARRQGLAYQAASEAVAAILIAAGAGYWADGRFDTSPIFLFLGTAIGFGAFVMRLLRLGRQLQALEAGDSDPDGKDDTRR